MNLNHNKIGALVQRVKQKDGQAFALLYERTYQKIYFLALSILKNEHDAQDAVQETYIKILASIDTLGDEKLFIAWSNRIAYNVSIRMLEKRKDVPMDGELMSAVPDHNMHHDPLTETIQDEQKRFILKSVQGLDPILRTTVLLKYFENMKINEIAVVMDCPSGTVKSRLNTAKKQLQASMSSERSASMFMGMFSMLPLRSIFQETTRGIGMSSHSAFDILTNTLTQQGISAQVSFTPTASAAAYTSASTGAQVGAVASVSTASLTAVALSALLLIAPSIGQIMIPTAYVAQTATVIVEAQGLSPISELYAVAPNGSRILGKATEKGFYELQLDENGDYIVYAISKNEKQATQAITVDCIDADSPVVVSYVHEDKLLNVAFSDKQSGVNLSTVYGELPDGTKMLPVSIDEYSNTAVFALPKESFTLYASDSVGNTSKNQVTLTRTYKQVG